MTRCNEVREGRSDGSHEVDVLAEKSDALTTFRVAVECKAWQQPIEKDVVSKLDYVVRDLGLNKGIIVSLAGWRSGAQRTAADLGVELWGPDELRRHLGESIVGELGVPPAAPSSTLTWGYQFAVAPEQGERTIRSSGKGRLRLRTLEQMAFFSAVWLPAYAIRVTIAQPEVKRFKTRLRSTTVDNLYEALSGSCLGWVPHSFVQVNIEQRLALPAVLPRHEGPRVAAQGAQQLRAGVLPGGPGASREQPRAAWRQHAVLVAQHRAHVARVPAVLRRGARSRRPTTRRRGGGRHRRGLGLCLPRAHSQPAAASRPLRE